MILTESQPSASVSLFPNCDPEAEARRAASESVVAECIEDCHPTLTGRVRVRWTDSSGEEQVQWVPTLAQVGVRKADRVLLTRACNWPEAVVIGVVDGFAVRPESPRTSAAAITLRPDEAVRVLDARGHELLEIITSESGPVVRLLQPDVNVELPGALKLNAASIEMTARSGPVSIQASDDVIFKGEVVRLN